MNAGAALARVPGVQPNPPIFNVAHPGVGRVQVLGSKKKKKYKKSWIVSLEWSLYKNDTQGQEWAFSARGFPDRASPDGSLDEGSLYKGSLGVMMLKCLRLA